MQFECIFNSHKLCYARHTKVTEPTEGLKIRGRGASSNEAGIICPSWLEGVNRFAKIWRGGEGQMLPLSPDSVDPEWHWYDGLQTCNLFLQFCFLGTKEKNNMIFYFDLNMSQASNASWNFEKTSTKLMTGLWFNVFLNNVL